MQVFDEKKLKLRTRVLVLLLASSFCIDMPYASADTTNDAEPTEILSQDNLPDLPPKEETAWLHGINNEVKEAEPEEIELSPKPSTETGAQAATMIPAPIAGPKLSSSGQAIEDETQKLAQAGDGPTVNGRIVSDPEQAPGAIEELTRQILLKEIALEKFNLNYKMNAAKQGRWKGWRYALANETSAALGIAGGIITADERGSHLHRSDKVKNYVQERANWISMIGTIIAGSAAIMEFGINEYHEYEAYTKGFSPGKAREHVNSLKNDINRLLAERAALVKIEHAAPMLTGRCEVDDLEGKVLADLRDQSLLEYQRFHVAARRLLAFQQCQYFFDLSKNTTNSIGYAFAYLAVHRRRRPWNYRAGVMFNVCGALTMGGPIASRLFAKGVSEYHRHYTRDTVKEAEAKECSILEQDQKALDAICKSGKFTQDVLAQKVERTAIYGDQSKIFQDEVMGAQKDLNKAKLVATQNVGAGLYVGGSKLASGILFTIPGFYRLYNGKTQTAGRVTNHLLFASGMVGLQASSFALLDTLRIQVAGELNRHKLASQGKLPGQLIKARLAQLDALEAKLSGSK